jgi:peptide/nickel transport system ATP-binding protein
VAEAADRVAVMYSGKVVETADVHRLFSSPAHPYTAGLLASILGEGTAIGRAFAIPGSPPAAAERPAGCAFQPRCHIGGGREECATTRPVLTLLPTPPSDADGAVHLQGAEHHEGAAHSEGSAHPAGRAAACHFAGESTLHLLKGQPA